MSVDDARILVIDDDPFVRDFAVHAIEFTTNRQVATFESGFRAWQFILDQSSHMDVVIADANIPDMNGLELLERIKKQFPEKIFILTSSNSAHEKTAYQMGADAFLSKPFDINDLFTIMDKLILSPADPR
ncbi:MAG: response regulator [Desulfobacteraceae bacterium]|nr:MAG: response regulator [Desulfobacteraceae bacterium]